ncbi:Integrin beta-1-binding protein 1 [Myotis davidii]|uniref:Integrin beta-1-binding protein 1 n=1 Tax=Myotis davidii TaxID=225400 RepID=L5MF38_MYODS|nr:Integrin beta-1-binding protein 1 [Myotis davidii]
MRAAEGLAVSKWNIEVKAALLSAHAQAERLASVSRRAARRWVSDPRRLQGWASGCESVDSSLGGLSRSSTVASLDTDSTKSSGQSTNNADACAEFRIQYVGAIEKVKLPEENVWKGHWT